MCFQELLGGRRQTVPKTALLDQFFNGVRAKLTGDWWQVHTFRYKQFRC